MTVATSGASQSELSSIYPLLSSAEATPADRLLLGLEQARMAVRLGLEPDPVVLGRFVLERLVGRGGMGMVFAAWDPSLERTVALKVLTFDSERARGLAVAEARALARLSHPNIVTVFEAGIEGEFAYVAMELIHGQTLREWLRARPRSVAELIPLFVAAGRGLAAAHAEGLRHRDFKPDNVLVGADGRVRVVDLGLARELDDVGEADSRAGTPAYMAPERLRGEPASAAADQFSFCMSVWEACCGARPYTLEGLRQLAFGGAEPLQIPTGLELPRALIDAMRIGLANETQLRWPDMDALIEALRRLAPDQPRSVERAARAQAIGLDPWTLARLERERWRRVGLGLASVVLVVASAVAGWWIAEVPDAPHEPERFSVRERTAVLRVGGHAAESEAVAQAAALAGQMQLLDAVFGRRVALEYIDSVMLHQLGASDPITARAGARRWLVQICLHAYLSVGEGRDEAADALVPCRFAVGDMHELPPTAIAAAVWNDELARFSHVFALALRKRAREEGDSHEWNAERRRCHAEVDWQRHLAGLGPTNRHYNLDECTIDHQQSGPRPDECPFYDYVPVEPHPSVWMSEPISRDPSAG